MKHIKHLLLAGVAICGVAAATIVPTAGASAPPNITIDLTHYHPPSAGALALEQRRLTEPLGWTPTCSDSRFWSWFMSGAPAKVSRHWNQARAVEQSSEYHTAAAESEVAREIWVTAPWPCSYQLQQFWADMYYAIADTATADAYWIGGLMNDGNAASARAWQDKDLADSAMVTYNYNTTHN
jgi:hypothetical protein